MFSPYETHFIPNDDSETVFFEKPFYAVPRMDFDSRKFSEAGAGKCEATPVFSQPQVNMYKVGCCFSFLELRVEEEKISVGLGSFREK